MIYVTNEKDSKPNSCTQKILFSQLLANIPSEEELIKLIPNPYQPQKPLVTPFGLTVLKLRLEGLHLTQIAQQLHTSSSRVSHWSSMTIHSLQGHLPETIEIDSIPLRKEFGIEPICLSGGYTKLSELLRDMPSDELLFQLDRERGSLKGNTTRHRINRRDLYVLQQRLAGRTYQSLAQEFGKSKAAMPHWIFNIKRGLVRNLSIELDVPGIFGKEKW